MKRFYKALVVLSFWLLIFNEGLAQLGEWTWVKGDSIAGRPGSFGTQLVPSPTNTPPSLYEPCEWTSLNKDFFYLFGGEHIGSNGDYWTNDLWRYNPSTNEWTWMKGNGLPSDTGNMGIQGVSSPNNLPPAATCAASWTDNAGDFWMYDGMSSTLYSSDVLWKYTVSTNEWTWIRGTKIPPLNSIPPVYGTQGVPGPANTPGNHIEGTSAWTDNAGDLWLFGGNSSTGTSNILWRYNVASNEWTWMKGAQNAVVASVYGNKGVEAPGDTPGARFAFSHWKDGNGNFWVYGGGNYDDLWRFNPSTNNWTWMNGNIAVTGSYGTQCIPSTNNTPGTKRENRAIWTDQGGNFWMFGGWNG